MRSYVVKRAPQARHSLRRLMHEPSSAALESTTLESRFEHLGQRIGYLAFLYGKALLQVYQAMLRYKLCA